MPISEAISNLRSRFGFHEPSDKDSTAFKDNQLHSSTLMNNGDKDKEHEIVERSSNQSFELQEDPSFWKDHNVQVVIRIRPLSNSEISTQGHNKCVKQDSCQTVTWIGHPESRFTFDLVADEHVSQEKLFKVAGLPMVENCVGGYNSCMFAYGQTGSGKTHTMLGDIDGGTRRHSVNCGMTPRVFEHLFQCIQKEKESRRDEKLKFTCKCSFLEIYNEQILDLLDPSSTNLQIREDAKKGIYVENLKELEVTCARDVIQQLVQGATNRKVAATNMNHASSRSHSVFTCIIESKWETQGVTHHRFARLNLVDLAGSERQKSSGAEGERLKEATNINKSLSTLGLVIMNLVNISNGKSLHVPYRDSKLTFLLQDSLGGNSKTTIIANISPSVGCSLETLSTLKFAQRAKFIKNNAIVNEDASGDVLTMRLQIQQLKKEVNHLRSLVNGGHENQENDNSSVCFPGSPGSCKWEGLQGSFSPLTTDKRKPQKKEVEAALVEAFRREKDKEIAVQALTAENQAAMRLAKQREDEIQGLKMRLRFREAGIKRLESVASGKISAEMHLLKEREEYLKEIEVLRAQVDRNQEVTRFAMENLRLKEELRRLKSFSEDGERERMSEQIMILQNKLLEALDWKLMHEADSVKKGNSSLANLEDSLLTSSQDAISPRVSSLNAENEYLRIQAIQNQTELDSLHKKLNFCLEEREKLQRQIEGLVTELENERRSVRIMEEEAREKLRAPSGAASNDPMELKTMVDAIAAASEREAEAHETAIILAKENDELRVKLKVLLEDNNKLIELYESVVVEGNKAKNAESQKTEDREDDHKEKDVENAMKIKNLEHQLQEMHAENERLMSLYEKTMQETQAEKVELKVKDAENAMKIENLDHQLQEMRAENDSLMGLYERAIQDALVQKTEDQVVFRCEKDVDNVMKIENLHHQLQETQAEYEELMGLYEKALQETQARKTEDKEKDAENVVKIEHQLEEMHAENDILLALYEKAIQDAQTQKAEAQMDFSSQKFMNSIMKIEDLEKQLKEMQAENDKLMGLYETALQGTPAQKIEEKGAENAMKIENLENQLEELHAENNVLLGLYENAIQDAQAQHTECQADIQSGKDLESTIKIKNLDHQLLEMLAEKDILVVLYEKAIQDAQTRKIENDADFHNEKDMHTAVKIENLMNQLQEMQEENNKLMGLYEKAMQEKDEVQRKFCSNAQSNNELNEDFHCLEKLVEVGGGQNVKFDDRDQQVEIVEHISNIENSDARMKLEKEEELSLAKMKLGKAQDKLEIAAKAASLFLLLEKAAIEEDKFSRETEMTEKCIMVKQQEIADFKLLSSEIENKKTIVDHKLLALKSSLSSFYSSIRYWEEREERARGRMDASLEYVEQKKELLTHLQARKDEIEVAQKKAHQSDTELRNNLSCLKSKLEEETRKIESEKVLLAIDNVPAQRYWHLGGKATELLISEEQQPKLQAKIKQTREKLNFVVKEIEDLRRRSEKLETDIEIVKKDVEKGLLAAEEMKVAFENVVEEKEMISDIKETGMNETEKMIIEYQQCVFELDLKKEEMNLLENELQMKMKSLDELKKTKAIENQKLTRFLDETKCSFMVSDPENQKLYVSEVVGKGIQDARISVSEAATLLGTNHYLQRDYFSSL